MFTVMHVCGGMIHRHKGLTHAHTHTVIGLHVCKHSHTHTHTARGSHVYTFMETLAQKSLDLQPAFHQLSFLLPWPVKH